MRLRSWAGVLLAGLVMLHGSQIVAGEVLGLKSGGRTMGHRFLGESEISLASADE